MKTFKCVAVYLLVLFIAFVSSSSAMTVSLMLVGQAANELNNENNQQRQRKVYKEKSRDEGGCVEEASINSEALRWNDCKPLIKWIKGFNEGDGASSIKEVIALLDKLVENRHLSQAEKERFENLKTVLRTLGDEERTMSAALVKFFILALTNKDDSQIQNQSKVFFAAVKSFCEEQKNSSKRDHVTRCNSLIKQTELIATMSDVLSKTEMYNRCLLGEKETNDYHEEHIRKQELNNSASRAVLQYSLKHAEKHYSNIKTTLDKLIARVKIANVADHKITELQKVSKQINHRLGFIGSYMRANKEMLRTNGTYRKVGTTVVFTAITAIKYGGEERGRCNAKKLQKKMRDTFKLLAKFEKEVERSEVKPSNKRNEDKKPASKHQQEREPKQTNKIRIFASDSNYPL